MRPEHTKTVPQHSFSGCVEHAIAHIEEAAVHDMPEEQQRWYAIKIFERDDKVLAQLKLDGTAWRTFERRYQGCRKGDVTMTQRALSQTSVTST